ncbi:Aerobic C4-dicarboxylate transport protein [compost metagenome]
MSEARALTNLVGNGVATVVVAKWCKQLDESTLRDELAAGPSSVVDAQPAREAA